MPLSPIPVGYADGRGNVRCCPCNERLAGILPHVLVAADINAAGERCTSCDASLIAQ